MKGIQDALVCSVPLVLWCQGTQGAIFFESKENDFIEIPDTWPVPPGLDEI